MTLTPEQASNLLSALQNLCIAFADMCDRTGYNAGAYYTYRAAQKVIEETLGETQ
jgi:hypothetical protein